MEPSSNNGIVDGKRNLKNFHCFFCHSHTLEEGDVHQYQLSLRNISRYLQLPPHDKSNNLSGQKTTCQYWSICDDCSQVATEFNELYHILEVIKLRLNWCLERLHGFMTNAENEPEPQAKALENGEGKYNQRKAVRAEMMGRMKGAGNFPLVSLLKTEVEELKPLLPVIQNCYSHAMEIDGGNIGPEDATELTPASIHGNSDVVIKMECDTDEEECVSYAPMSMKTDKATIKSVKISTTQKAKKVESSKLLKCSFCRAQFQESSDGNINVGKRLLRLHMIQYHTEKIFSSNKLDSVTDAQYKKLLCELLFKDLINESTETFCVYCNKKFRSPPKTCKKSSYLSRIKGHFVKSHYEELEKKLKNLQTNPEISNILQDCNSSDKMCKCGAYLQNLRGLKMHERWHCPLITKTERPPNPNQVPKKDYPHLAITSSLTGVTEYSCKKCKKTFTNRTSAIRHMCSKRKRPPLPGPSWELFGC